MRSTTLTLSVLAVLSSSVATTAYLSPEEVIPGMTGRTFYRLGEEVEVREAEEPAFPMEELENPFETEESEETGDLPAGKAGVEESEEGTRGTGSMVGGVGTAGMDVTEKPEMSAATEEQSSTFQIVLQFGILMVLILGSGGAAVFLLRKKAKTPSS